MESICCARNCEQLIILGLSEPSPVIKKLPHQILQNLLTNLPEKSEFKACSEKTRNISKMLFNRSQTSAQTNNLTSAKISQLLDDPSVFKKLQAELTLCSVAKEIDELSGMFPYTYLLNQIFVKQRFSEEILETPNQIVHIASHGVFGGSSDQSFIMAFDDIILMDELASFLESDKFGDEPIELLTLSACQTAEGDDRAPLGISGMAFKANVRSVLGSLWSVPDEETALLMKIFYSELAKPKVSKAQALQQAQIIMLQNPDTMKNHPFFWAPFILVGNWL